MKIATENPTTGSERALPCVVRHPDAGGQCERPAVVLVYGLAFCELHGAELLAALPTSADKQGVTRRPSARGGRAPVAGPKGDATQIVYEGTEEMEERALAAVWDIVLREKAKRVAHGELVEVTERLADEEAPTAEYWRALLLRAYPNVPQGVRTNILQWELDEGPNSGAVVDTLLGSLGTLAKLMRVAYEDGETWLVELLECERESVAAQAAHALSDRAEDRPVR